MAYADDDFGNQTFTFDIPSQSADSALTEFAEQADLTLVFPDELVRDRTANALVGEYSLEEGAAILLEGTGLIPSFSNPIVLNITIDDTSSSGENAMNATKKAGLFAIIAGALSGGANAQEPGEVSAQNEERPAPQTISQQRDSEEIRRNEEAAKKKRGLAEFVVIDEIIVRGKNVGVRRFEDDPQPYVVFDSQDIEASMSTTLEDFLRTRLPQNTQSLSGRQFTSSIDDTPGNVSTIDLRGLGQDETLILINGRRAPRVSLRNNFRQADINGIPLSSIERIEILPSTASGIYGGGATGGVINIITRRDYVGGELGFEYTNTFDTDVGTRRLDGSFGFALEGGRTNVTISASYSDANDMVARDRPFAQASRDLLLENDPSAFLSGTLSSTPNVFSFSGDLVLLDGRNLGSAYTFVPIGYTGLDSDNGQALVDNAGQLNFALPESFDGLGQRIIQSPINESASLSVNRDFTDSINVFVDASIYSNEGQNVSVNLPRFALLRAGDAGNPFQNDFVRVVFPAIGPAFESSSTSETVQVATGANWNFSEDWTALFDYSWSRSRFESVSSSGAFDVNSPVGVGAAVRDGSLDVFRDVSQFPLDLSPFENPTPTSFDGPRDTELTNFAFRVSGAAFDLPAGSININLLTERRNENVKGSFSDSLNTFTPPPSFFETRYTPPREQSVDSLYAEALVPILSDEMDSVFGKSLQLQFAMRYDDYETISPLVNASVDLTSRGDALPTFEESKNTFSSTDYTVGLRYEVSDDLLLRASYATGFVPPNVTQIAPLERENAFIFATDPLRPGIPFFFVDEVQQLGNPDLRPEESESFSIGMIFTPRFLPGFRLSIDYTVVDKTDEIAVIPASTFLELEAGFPDRIRRAPLSAADEAAGFTGGEIEFFNLSPINLATSGSKSWDIQLDQSIDTESYGAFEFYAIATYMESVDSQILSDSSNIERVGFRDGPLQLRGNFGLNWQSPNRNWALGWNAQYYDDYLVYNSTDSQGTIDLTIKRDGRASIPTEIYHDLSLVYRPELNAGRFADALNGVEVRLGIQNVFDKVPAIRAAATGFDTRGRFSAYGDLRLRRYSIAVRKSF